jgi:hypothetical protein
VLGEIFDFVAPGKFCDFVPVLHIDRVQNLVGRLKRIMAPLEFRMGRKYLLMATLQSGVTRLQVRKGGRGHISSWGFKAQQGEIRCLPHGWHPVSPQGDRLVFVSSPYGNVRVDNLILLGRNPFEQSLHRPG